MSGLLIVHCRSSAVESWGGRPLVACEQMDKGFSHVCVSVLHDIPYPIPYPDLRNSDLLINIMLCTFLGRGSKLPLSLSQLRG